MMTVFSNKFKSTIKQICALSVDNCRNYQSVGPLSLSFVDRKELSFENAKKRCEECGGILAEPRDDEQNRAVISFLGKQNITGCVWIGITDLIRENV